MKRLFLPAVGMVLVALAVACGEGELAPSVTPSPSATAAVPSPTAIASVPSPTVAPSPSQLPSPTMRPEAAARQLAVGQGDTIWIVNADGSDKTGLTNGVCTEQSGYIWAEQSGRIWWMTWAPTGDKLALICNSTDTTSLWLVVLDASGNILATAPRADHLHFRWAPDGERLAYQTGASLGSIESAQVRMLDLSTLEDSLIAEDAWLLDWPLSDRLLLGFNLTPGDRFIVRTYEANWFDLATGETERVQRLDNNARFWMTPDGKKAVVFSGPASREGGGVILGIYDFETGDEQPVAGSVIGYPSDGIPGWRLAISSDGERFYWGDFGVEPGDAIYRANIDGTGLTLVARLPGLAGALSGDGLVVYSPIPSEGDRRGKIILDLESGASVEIDVHGQKVWRPTQIPAVPTAK